MSNNNGFDDVTPVRGRAPGDQYSNMLDEELKAAFPASDSGAHKLDSQEARKTLNRLLGWFYMEREKQSANRLEMATDYGFYDNKQWDEDDEQALRERGQMPLVYNEVAPMVDWVIGTERRSRVDWKVLPRAEDDVEIADIKTKVLKFVSDINRIAFNRSRAFADAVKCGVGWLDDGARDDPTQDILYSKYEDWRNVLWDSSSYELDLDDARYVFRWRWVDEDIALAMFPDRQDQIRTACEDGANFNHDGHDDAWYMGEQLSSGNTSGAIYASGSGHVIDTQRRRVKLIEAQFRMPAQVKIIGEGPMKGAFFADNDAVMRQIVSESGCLVIDRVMMRTHVAVMTERDLLSLEQSGYRHNKFSLTPVWCYRRGSDRQPYGIIRRVRSVQQDLNKRASKALFMLNTNQIIADEDATDDWRNLRDEADRPDGLIIKRAGKELTLRRDTDAATGQVQMMTLDAQSIQKSAGVSQENLGRQTNAVSGEAIKARQLQGSVVTTEPFDNLRLAVQVQGEKLLSLIEQFYSEEKVIRLTGARGALEWIKFNKPEVQPDGSVRFINDITASQADFIVSEQDYSGTLRQVMFDSINEMASRLPPEVSLRLLTIAMEYSDMPNKDEVANAIRKITGERDDNKPMTPEEAAQAEEQMRAQAESMQLQRETAMIALEESRARVREINARAAEIERNADGASDGNGMPPEVANAIRQVQSQAADQIDALSRQLAKAQNDLANRTMQISRDADVKLETARIDADAKVRVAEIQRDSEKQIAALEDRMNSIVQGLEQKLQEKIASDASHQKTEPASQSIPPQPQQPLTVNVQIDAKSGLVKKEIKVDRDKDGNIVGATSVESEDGNG